MLAGEYISSTIELSAYHIEKYDLSPAAQDISRNINFITLRVKNKTKHLITIDTPNMTPKMMPLKEIASFIPQAYGCYFIPAVILGAGGFIFLWKIGIPLAGLFTLFGINQSKKAAEHTKNSLSIHLLNPRLPVTIPPLSTSTYLMAINKKDYTPSITFPIQTSKKEYGTCTLELCKSTSKSYAFS